MNVKRCVSKFLESNTFILIKDDQAIIVDAGAELKDVINAVNGKKVKGLFLTHGHYDHAYYALSYIDYFKCPVYMNTSAIKALKRPEYNYGENFSINFHSVLEINRDCEIDCDKFNIKAYLTPGHSECSVSYLIENHLFAGDTVFCKGIGRTDLITSDEKDMLKSLNKVLALNFNVLHSGHDRDSTRQEQERNLNVYIKFLQRNKK